MSLSTDQFIELLSGGRETRGVEFKAAGPRGDPLVFAFVARAVLAMSNLQLGGWVLLGVQDDGQMSGLVQGDLASWLEHDEVTAGLNAYADPFVQVDVERVDHEAKSFIAIRVHEFAEVPGDETLDVEISLAPTLGRELFSDFPRRMLLPGYKADIDRIRLPIEVSRSCWLALTISPPRPRIESVANLGSSRWPISLRNLSRKCAGNL